MGQNFINPAKNDSIGVGPSTNIPNGITPKLSDLHYSPSESAVPTASTVLPETRKRIPEGASLLSDGAFKYVYARDDERSRANLRQLVSILLGRNVVYANVLPTEVFASTTPSTEKASRYDIRVLVGKRRLAINCLIRSCHSERSEESTQ